MTFKRGASPEVMSADDRACRGTTTDEPGYVDCMRGRGWFVAVTGDADTGAMTAPALKPPAEAPEVDAAAEATPSPAPVTPGPAGADPTATASPMPSPGGADSLPRVHISSWWKLGGNPADLDRSIAACVVQLGPPHKPDPAATFVTVAMRACLHQAGWYGLESGSP